MVDYRLLQQTVRSMKLHVMALRNIQTLSLPFLTLALIWRNWMGLSTYDSQLFSLIIYRNARYKIILRAAVKVHVGYLDCNQGMVAWDLISY